jgi:WD40 repeat protein
MADYDVTRAVEVNITKTPSLRYNNLTCNGSNVVFAHKTEVVSIIEDIKGSKSGTVGSTQSTLKPHLPEAKVIQVKWCHLSGRDYLVVGTGSGLAVYDDTITASVFVLELASQDVPYDDPEATFVRGITGVPETNHICAGSASGHIFCLLVDGDGEGGSSIELVHTIKPHEDDDGAATTAMAGSGRWGVAASDAGSVTVFDTSNKFHTSHRFPGIAPCTSVVVTGDTIVAGYTTGHLRMFRLSTGVLFAEIGAHTRAVTAMDVHPEMPVFVSVGEDSVINVWRLSQEAGGESKREQAPSVTMEFTGKSADSLLTGVSFSRNGTSHLITSSYDKKCIQWFTHR